MHICYLLSVIHLLLKSVDNRKLWNSTTLGPMRIYFRINCDRRIQYPCSSSGLCLILNYDMYTWSFISTIFFPTVLKLREIMYICMQCSKLISSIFIPLLVNILTGRSKLWWKIAPHHDQMNKICSRWLFIENIIKSAVQSCTINLFLFIHLWFINISSWLKFEFLNYYELITSLHWHCIPILVVGVGFY